MPELHLNEPGSSPKIATSHTKKVDALHKVWFKKSADINAEEVESLQDGSSFLSGSAQYPTPMDVNADPDPDDDRVMDDVKVRGEFRKLQEGKAAGKDGISPNFLIIICRKPLTSFLARLFTACMLLCYFPDCWKIGRIIAIPKAGRPGASCNEPTMWRPICLLSCYGKLFESYLASVLAKYAQEKDMLPSTQMAGRGRSTTTALLYVLGIIRTARKNGLVVSIMSLDQTGAFNNVRMNYLLKALRLRGVPEWLVKLIQSFLSYRRTTICIPGYESELYDCFGIPQGSPLSPILFAFFTYGLLQHASDVDISLEESETGLIFKIAYSDDAYIIAVSNCLKATKSILQKEFSRCQSWTEQSGASFNPKKVEVIHFASVSQGQAPPMSHYIPDLIGEDNKKHLKMLGIVISVDGDGNLSWTSHFKEMSEKVERLERDFKRIVKMTSCLEFHNAVQVYTACIRPSFTYGCAAWFEPEDTPWYLDKTEYKDEPAKGDSPYHPLRYEHSMYSPNDKRRIWNAKLEKFQCKFLRIILGSFQKVPRFYLRKDTWIESADLFAYRTAVATRSNLIGTEVWYTIERAAKRVDDFARLTAPRSDKILRNRSLLSNLSQDLTVEMSERAMAWRAAAESHVHKFHTSQELSNDDNLDEDDEDYPEDVPLTSAARDAISELSASHDMDEDPLSVLASDSSHIQKVKRKTRSIARKWADEKMRVSWELWKRDKSDEILSTGNGRPLPPILKPGETWGKHNRKQYKGLDRPECSIYFQMRSEYIGFNQHLRDLRANNINDVYCRLCGESHYETVTHLLHFCSALAHERQALYRTIRPRRSRKETAKEFRDHLLRRAPAQAARFALRNFPTDQFEWIRLNLKEIYEERWYTQSRLEDETGLR
jgi:hypothetical protein